MGDETYMIDNLCANCKEISTLLIKKGITVETYLKNQKCDKCGCLVIKKWELNK